MVIQIIRFIKKLRMIYIRFRHREFLFAQEGFTCGRGTVFFAKNRIRIGKNVYIGKYCTIECDACIGNEVLIANNVGMIGRRDHDYKKIGMPVRFAPCMQDSDYNPSRSEVIIGDDVWIGFGSIIFSGVSIGEGSIVAAGSLVLDGVEPFTIVGGNPARVIGKRFTDEEIELHKEECHRHNYASYSAKFA